MKKFLLAVMAVLATAPAFAAKKHDNSPKYWVEDDDQKVWTEESYTLPGYPSTALWRPVAVGGSYTNKLFVDETTLGVGSDAALRMITRVVSPSGVENLAVEGLNCKLKTYRTYAFGDAAGKKWMASFNEDWRAIAYDDKVRRALFAAFCDEYMPPSGREQAVKLLRGAN
ncbi:CNP1-like family protein [Gulbenkiania mobilis]|uniref:CNP1-like family protein n=1 Tax=Gulbenkiania mobilis TaxID=397457 RepID=A0ABY2CZH3_GULMO|nr:CNP1-like family protein [Gulbenkiania mobilis]